MEQHTQLRRTRRQAVVRLRHTEQARKQAIEHLQRAIRKEQEAKKFFVAAAILFALTIAGCLWIAWFGSMIAARLGVAL